MELAGHWAGEHPKEWASVSEMIKKLDGKVESWERWKREVEE